MITPLRYQLNPSGGCSSCNRARDIAADVGALSDLDNLVQQETTRANEVASSSTATASFSNSPASSEASNEASSNTEARNSNSTANSENKSQFVSPHSKSVASQNEGVSLRSAYFATGLSTASFHATSSASNHSTFVAARHQSAERIVSAPSTGSSVNSSGTTSTSTTSARNATVASFTASPPSIVSASKQGMAFNNAPTLSLGVPSATAASTTVQSRASFPTSSMSAARFASNSPLSNFQNSATSGSLTGSNSLVSMTQPLPSLTQWRASLQTGLQSFMGPLLQNFGTKFFQEFGLSSSKNTLASTKITTQGLNPLGLATNSKNMNFSMQMLARFEKGMLNFLRLMQGSYLQTLTHSEHLENFEPLEDTVLTEKLALLRKLQENEKKEKKKKTDFYK